MSLVKHKQKQLYKVRKPFSLNVNKVRKPFSLNVDFLPKGKGVIAFLICRVLVWLQSNYIGCTCLSLTVLYPQEQLTEVEQRLKQSQKNEESLRSSLRSMEESAARLEAEKLKQLAQEVM